MQGKNKLRYENFLALAGHSDTFDLYKISITWNLYQSKILNYSD